MEYQVKPRSQKSRNSRRAFIRRRRQRDLLTKAALFIVILVGVVVGAILIKNFGSSKEKADLNKYYGIEKENQQLFQMFEY